MSEISDITTVARQSMKMMADNDSLRERIAELEKSELYWKEEAERYAKNANYWGDKHDQLAERINQAIPLVGHKSHDSRLRLLEILGGNNEQ